MNTNWCENRLLEMNSSMQSALAMAFTALSIMLTEKPQCPFSAKTPFVKTHNRVWDEVENSIGMKFVQIAPGKFSMGSPEDEEGRFTQEVQHEVEISRAFYLGATEVTVGQFRQVMSRSSSNGKDDWAETNVSWHDAVEFCRRLTDLSDEQSMGREYRLPTEAEWEFACRAGSKQAFCFGANADMLVQYASMDDQEAKSRRPVATMKPNAWGLYDMHGGAWEWCSDWYGDYPPSLVVDPEGPLSGHHRVLRGGCHESPVSYCRCAMRMPFDPARQGSDSVGLRVVLVMKSPVK